MILAIYMADKRLIFEIKNPHKSIRKTTQKKWAKDMKRHPIKRKHENGQQVFEKIAQAYK